MIIAVDVIRAVKGRVVPTLESVALDGQVAAKAAASRSKKSRPTVFLVAQPWWFSSLL
jgi:hypothetical protein